MARVEIFTQKADRYSRRVTKARVQELVRVVERDGKYHASRYTGNTARPSPTGELARSIKGSVTTRGRWQVLGRVGSNLRESMVVHIGAKPHLIRPRGDWPMVFYWKLKGRKIKTRGTIHHPGMHGKFYLTEPLKIEGRRLGFRVVLARYTERLYR